MESFKFDADSSQIITKNGEKVSISDPKAFKLISDLWLRSGWDTKYVYGFSWLGRPIIQLPEDLIRIQELIFQIKPDVIIETGVAHGGSLVFYASIFNALGKGRVIGIDIEIRPHNRKEIEKHTLKDFITLVEGSSIDPNVLQALRWEKPLINKKGLTIYEEPSTNKLYACTVDVALGKGKDYSAFLIYDITQIPYRIVAVYRDNTITPLVFPNVIHSLVKQYNNAYTLVEIDGSGAQVGDILRHDLGYENLLMTFNAGRNGIQISSGFKRSAMMGLKMTRPVKNIGCMTLKNLVEQEKIILRDVNVITEFYSFAQKGQSFEATPGTHDDLVMCCVSFSWLVAQRYFAELTDVNLRENLLNDVEEETWDSLTPFGFIDDGLMDIPSETQHVAREGNDDWLDNRGTDWL